jgi:hypothetical protein
LPSSLHHRRAHTQKDVEDSQQQHTEVVHRRGGLAARQVQLKVFTFKVFEEHLEVALEGTREHRAHKGVHGGGWVAMWERERERDGRHKGKPLATRNRLHQSYAKQ